jgi:senataxin
MFVQHAQIQLPRCYHSLSCSQLQPARRAITARLGAAVVAELDAAKSINTVDGFQGAERDIIIFSCVRTGRSLGFTDDVQRINVGLTRARHSLWVLGNVAALARSTHWGKLVRHAHATGRLLEFHDDL